MRTAPRSKPELSDGPSGDDDDDEDARGEDEDDAPEIDITREELAIRWISYAAGIVLGRFQPGIEGALGSAIVADEEGEYQPPVHAGGRGRRCAIWPTTTASSCSIRAPGEPGGQNRGGVGPDAG